MASIRAQLEIDAERANRLILNGFVPLQFTYTQIVEGADAMLDTIREAFARFAPGVLVRT
jgi:very-short-patch-repair endonuclease